MAGTERDICSTIVLLLSHCYAVSSEGAVVIPEETGPVKGVVWFSSLVAGARRTAGGVKGGAPAAAVAARTNDLDDVGRVGAMLVVSEEARSGFLLGVVGVRWVQLQSG